MKGKTGAKAKNDEYMSGLGKRIAEMSRVTGRPGEGNGRKAGNEGKGAGSEK